MFTRVSLAVACLIVLALGAACAGAPVSGPGPIVPASPVSPPPQKAAQLPSPSPIPDAAPVLAPLPANPGQDFSREEASILMEELVRGDPTFLFDGIEETLKLAEVKEGAEPFSWTFTFEFQSRHAGYGDRTGRVLAQVITPHRAVIAFQQGDITSAVIDGRWDMIEERELR